jgi:hypothetical protein
LEKLKLLGREEMRLIRVDDGIEALNTKLNEVLELYRSVDDSIKRATSLRDSLM